MEIKDYSFDVTKWYISDNEPYIFGKLQSGLHLMSQRSFTFYDNKDDFLNKLDELGLEFM
jgi:hypothetical protein